jgi:hypothetical protein
MQLGKVDDLYKFFKLASRYIHSIARISLLIFAFKARSNILTAGVWCALLRKNCIDAIGAGLVLTTV